jgi:excisionase family DNA binding protein
MDMTDRIALRPAEFVEAFGISRSKAYELIKSGEIPSVTIGGVTRVPVAAAQELMARKLAERA